MKKILSTGLLLTVMHSYILAQFTLQPGVPTVGMLQKNQLWNVLVINGSGQSYDCRLDVVVRDRISGEELFTGSSSQFVSDKGARQLNINLLSPVQYNYISYGSNNNLQGYLPVGNYTVCYTLSKIPAQDFSLANECVSVDVEPLSPPMLIYPADSSELDVSPTQFNWTPPTPAGMFDMLQYEVVVSEIIPGQKADEAIQENLPFYTSANQQPNFLNYPTSSQNFEKDKWYAWQVVAKDNKSYAAKSETWVFKIKNPVRPLPDPSNDGFLVIKNKSEGIHIIHTNTLFVKYYSFQKDYQTVISFLSADGKELYQSKQKVKYGDNFFSFNLNRHFEKGKVYSVVFDDNQNNKHTALFSIQ